MTDGRLTYARLSTPTPPPGAAALTFARLYTPAIPPNSARLTYVELFSPKRSGSGRISYLRLFTPPAAVARLSLAYVRLYVPQNSLVASAGPDRNAEPWSAIQLRGLGSGGVITGYLWTDVAGDGSETAVPGAGANRDIMAPPDFAGVVKTYRLVVTDGVVSSAPDEVVVTVLPATEGFLSVDGTWRPMQLMALY